MRQKLGRALLLVASLSLLAYYVAPLWRETHSWGGTRDWLYFFFMAEVDRLTILRYHQFPLWNPYYCGGAVHLANPQTFFLSPTLIFILLFGTPVGIRLTITASILLAFDGTRRLARAWKMETPSTLVAGCSYAVSGAFAQHLGGGHVGWLGFGVLPYVLLSFHHAMDGERQHIVYSALGLAWIFGHFGVYPYPYAVLTLGMYALLLGMSRKQIVVAIALGSTIVALSLAFAAVRLLPLLDFIREHPRPVFDDDALSIKDLWSIYTDPNHPRAFPKHQWVWPEFGNYFGKVGVALFLLGAFIQFRRGRKYWPLVGGAVAFLLLQLGNTPSMPWWILKQLDLPIIRNLRVPSRFTTVVGLFAALVIGFAVDVFLRAPRGRRGSAYVVRIGLAVFVVVSAVSYLTDAASVNRTQWLTTLGTPPPEEQEFTEFHQAAGDASRMYAYPRMNRGSIACFEESPLDISKQLKTGLINDEYLDDPTAGALQRMEWTPNRISLDVVLSHPTDVIVNQNYEKNWHVDGGDLVSHQGLLAARVPSGHSHVIFYYRPRGYLLGLLVTLLSMLATVPFALRASIRRWRRNEA